MMSYDDDEEEDEDEDSDIFGETDKDDDDNIKVSWCPQQRNQKPEENRKSLWSETSATWRNLLLFLWLSGRRPHILC